MMKRIFANLFLCLFPLTALSQVIQLEGKVDGQYAVVIELERGQDGVYSGRYAYKSTLREKGDVPNSYLYIQADKNDPYGNWVVRDNEGAVKERWYSVNFSDRRTLMVRMKNNRGAYCDIEASADGLSASDFPLISYFRHHLGDYAHDFEMFNNTHVSSRLQKMMGLFNFNEMKDIYQGESTIEYRNGLYYASGYKAHSGGDPMTAWAYDSRSNKFYVWIRKDGQNYWWGEDGKVVFEFRELVELNL